MSSNLQGERDDARSLVEAAAWRTLLSEHDVESTREFEIWLAADIRNSAAWERVQDLWGFVGEQATSPQVLELRRAALSHVRQASRRRWVGAVHSRTRLVASAAALVVAAGVGFLMWRAYSPDVYRTQSGERRVVMLADRSQVQLDSSTELQVRYSAHARELTLLKGQARFNVAHDVERPFSVLARGEKVVAVGTSFNVDLSSSALLVTLIEGRVVILPPPGTTSAGAVRTVPPAGGAADPRSQRFGDKSERGIELGVGEQLVVSASGYSNVVAANIERAIAWQNGQLVFDDERLDAVIERINRYSPRPLILADDRVARLRISGVFNTDDIAALVDTLTSYLPIDAADSGGAIRLRHR